ncbi:MAG: type 4a pilus biogenesis protein PilO [Desulfobacteraceae bacterium]|nr:type 4a pilus biogenesis protein PilO [Desulfobacteraceae bacterium]MBC2757007.1 type 4a pilus biogenesis protein PilO [Desulfobacteraceae bacterium]
MKKIDISLNSIEPLIKQISELTKVQRIIICCVLVALIVGVFVYFLYMPKYEDINKLKKEIAQQEEKLKETKKSAQQYAKFQKKLEAAQAKFNVVAKALPVTDEVPSLLTGISQVGKDAGLTFLLFKPEPETMKEFYAELPVTMNLSGSYHDLGVFFDQLAGMSRIVNIKKFDIQISQKGKKGSVPGSGLNIACTAETYKFVESPPPASDDDAKGKGKKKKKK